MPGLLYGSPTDLLADADALHEAIPACNHLHLTTSMYDQSVSDVLLAWMVVLPLPRSFCSKVFQLVPGQPLFWYTAAAWD